MRNKKLTLSISVMLLIAILLCLFFATAGYGTAGDVNGHQIFVVQKAIPGNAYINGKKTVAYFLVWIMVLFVLSLLIIVALHRRMISNKRQLACMTERNLSARKQLTDRLARLNECFLSFTADPDENIRLITSLCGELMGAACALYNRLEEGLLHVRADWNAPPDFARVDKPDGHLCTEVINRASDDALVVNNLPETPYAASDPNVDRYLLQTYIGVPVKIGGKHVGSLCAVYLHDYSPTAEDRKFMGILASAIGIEEERRQAAEALRRFTDEMEIMVRDRTEELRAANEQLRIDIEERKRMEEEILRARKIESLGVLAGGIAHDFNNLLTGILGNISLTKMLLKTEDKAFARLCEAEKASMRARDLTQQLLTFSMGGAPVKKTTDIRQTVRDSTCFVLSGTNVRCEFSFAADLWPVDADEGQMSQVINNLVINAGQAMPDGGVVRVLAENVAVVTADALPLAEGNYVRVSVIDNGTGIPEENLSKIFDPYFTTKKMGSGLGLATVYSIVKNHDGHVTVGSKPDMGTTFHLYIPASQVVLRTNGFRAAEHASCGGSGRVLVMDDEEVIRGIACEILEYLGYRVDVCADGAEAVAMYRNAVESRDPFVAVIMDLTVPGGMGGREAMKALLEIDPKARGIVSSGYSNDPVVAEYRKFGFCGVVAKPYRVEDLGEALQGLR